MAKKSFQDIKRPEKKQIEKKISSDYFDTHFNKEKESKYKENREKIIENYSPGVFEDKKRKIEYHRNDLSSFYPQKENNNKHRYVIWGIAFVSMISLFFAISLVFSKATITLLPKIKQLSFNQNFSASKDASANEISFDLMSLSDGDVSILQGGEEKDVKENARGKVVLYNDYSIEPQPLLIDTRLEGSNGKIYKTKTKIVIPGKSKDGNPGKVSVEIYAENPGPEYNSEPLDFKIYGFKKLPKYTKFYGRSVGNITGGYIGKTREISQEDKIKAEDTLKTNLETKLFNKALSQIPKGYVLYKNATMFSVDEKTFSNPDTEGKITFNMKGTLRGIVIGEEKLTKKIISSLLPDNKEEVYISNINDLSFSLQNKSVLDFSLVSDINFNIYGVPKIVYKVDEKKVIGDLLRREKKDFKRILSTYENIESAEMSIKPFWKTTFPENPEKFRVEVKYPIEN